ncbi:hypothetical protein QUA81_13510 [Microcoleus sp. F6_B4]
MLSTLLNCLPKSIVSCLARQSIKSLQARQEDECHEHLGLLVQVKCFYFNGEESWSWYVYDRLKTGEADNPQKALEDAQEWINNYDSSNPTDLD